jgi:hypothetical protein
MGERINKLKVTLNGRLDHPEDNGKRAPFSMIFGIAAGLIGYCPISALCACEAVRQYILMKRKDKKNPSIPLNKIPVNLT